MQIYIFILIGILVAIPLISSADAPNINDGTEVVLKDYKYSNNSNVILSGKQDIKCSWYPQGDAKQDLKKCSVEIEVNNQNVAVDNIGIEDVDFTTLKKFSPALSYSTRFNIVYEEDMQIVKNKTSGHYEKVIELVERKEWVNYRTLNPATATALPDKLFSIRAVFDMPKNQELQFNITLPSISANLDPDISACGTLDVANSLYVLNTSIITTSDCFVINDTNITLDFDDYKITGDGGPADWGVELKTTANETLIKNGKISNFAIGILAPASHDSNITGMKFSTIKFEGIDAIGDRMVISNNLVEESDTLSFYGIYVEGSNLTVDNNIVRNINVSDDVGYGIYSDLDGVNIYNYNNVFSNNQIYNINVTSDLDAYGFVSQYNENSILNNTYIADISSGYAVTQGMLLGGFANNYIENTHIENINSWNTGGSIGHVFGINLDSANNTFINGNFSIGAGDAASEVINFGNVDTINNTFINCSYNTTQEDANAGTLIRKWFYKTYVNDTDGNSMNEANVTISNSSTLLYNFTTSPIGQIEYIDLIDYTNIAGTRYYESNYTITATKNIANKLYSEVINSWNITEQTNKDDNHQIEWLAPFTIDADRMWFDYASGGKFYLKKCA